MWVNKNSGNGAIIQPWHIVQLTGKDFSFFFFFERMKMNERLCRKLVAHHKCTRLVVDDMRTWKSEYKTYCLVFFSMGLNEENEVIRVLLMVSRDSANSGCGGGK